MLPRAEASGSELLIDRGRFLRELIILSLFLSWEVLLPCLHGHRSE